MGKWRTCRFCGRYGTDLVTYATRHNAHASCLLNARGWLWILGYARRPDVLGPAVAARLGHEALCYGRLLGGRVMIADDGVDG